MTSFAEEVRHLTLIVSSGLDGQIGVPDCRGGHPAGRTIAHLASSVEQARKEATAEGRTILGTLYLGDLTGPGALSRHLAAQPQGAARLAALFGETGFTNGILGKHWLDQPPALLAGIVPALPSTGPVLLSANINCSGRPDCAVLDKMSARTVIDLPGMPVTLIGATDDGVLKAIDPAVSQGLSIAPVPAAILAEAADAREKGSQLVIAAVNFDGSNHTPQYLDQVSESLPTVDLVVLNQLGRFRQSTTVVANVEGPSVVVSGAAPTEVVRIDFEAAPGPERWRLSDIRAHRVASSEPNPALAASVQQLHQEYCAAWSRELPVVADPPVSKEAFLSELLETMRNTAQTEIAIANERLVASDVFPLTGPLSRADVFAALRYEDTLMERSVPGSWVTELWQSDSDRKEGNRPGLAWLGIEQREDGLWVNGRPLDDDARYTVVVPDFLAHGGDGWILDSSGFRPVRSAGQPRHLTELMLDSLSLHKPGTSFGALEHVDLAKRFRWTWSSALTLSANDLRGANQTIYSDSRLLRPTSTVFGGDLSGQVEAAQIDHQLRLSARARYYAALVDKQSFELDDVVLLEALYGLKTVRRVLQEKWYAPIPYAAATLDTEFVPTVGERYRQLELGGALGSRFDVAGPFEVKVAFGVRRQLLDAEGQLHLGANIGFDLPRFSSLRILQTPIDLESSLDYFVAPETERVFQEARLRARLLIPLIGPLGFSAGFDLFLYQAADGPVALLTETNAGITVRLDGTRQMY